MSLAGLFNIHMITLKERIINRLISTIYADKKDPTVIRVDIDNAVNILSNFGYLLPSGVFETKLEHLLNSKLTGANVTPGLKYAMADLIVTLADKMHIEEDKIVKYIMEHNTEEDVKELQSKIKNWRKEYYGSLSKSEKQALLDALQDKLRPDVLDDIRRA